MKVEYIKSESRPIQGTKEKIFKKYSKDWSIKELGNGNGNWLLTRKSDVLVDGKSYRSYILDYYSRSRLTEKLFEKFRDDLESGKIRL